MAKLARLVDGMTAALQIEPSRIRTAAAQLRKYKLLSSGPRGSGAPEMGPTDAANLLLAVMYDGELADAQNTVQRLRAAKLCNFEGSRPGPNGEKMHSLPRNGFITTSSGEAYDLGTLLETALDWWVRYGYLDEGDEGDNYDLDVVNFRLEVSCPGYQADVSFNTPTGLFWRLRYEWKSPERIAYEADGDQRFRAVWNARTGPHLWSSRTVSEDCLYQLAQVLRGCEWNDEWDEFTPSYDAVQTKVLETA
ncbi:hypothetical protein G7077_11520 [Sphingomonas piscis]|uniref:Uncharacterized protein n=1 Tax=Sphingomonas piscis TaxID=2714943 RepID=A0A6G7YRS1_9SPHN|nr:hypothetical protein [Sphingomonas piscis]QIK79440.1 hypothetical protein G7077_11520 [Sphingomonas piscis]